VGVWFALVLAPLPLYALTSLWLARRERRLNDPVRQRRHLALRAVEAGLESLRKSASANDAPAFFTALSTVLQERIGLALGVTAAGITEEVLEERLRPKGLSETDLVLLSGLFEAINQARYSPMSSVAQLEELHRRAESACAALAALEAKQ
jgi:hypothetical protein